MSLFSEQIRTKLTSDFSRIKDYFIVNSMSLEYANSLAKIELKAVKITLKMHFSKIFAHRKKIVFYGCKLFFRYVYEV